MRVGLFLVLLLAGGCAFAKSLQSGLTFYQLREANAGQRVDYRFTDGTGWRKAKARPKWADRPLYDYGVAPSSTVLVESRLVRNGQTISTARLKISARADTRFDLHSEIRPDDLTRGCFGCGRPAASAPIAGLSGQRLWLWYGWNGISHTVIF